MYDDRPDAEPLQERERPRVREIAQAPGEQVVRGRVERRAPDRHRTPVRGREERVRGPQFASRIGEERQLDQRTALAAQRLVDRGHVGAGRNRGRLPRRRPVLEREDDRQHGRGRETRGTREPGLQGRHAQSHERRDAQRHQHSDPFGAGHAARGRHQAVQPGVGARPPRCSRHVNGGTEREDERHQPGRERDPRERVALAREATAREPERARQRAGPGHESDEVGQLARDAQAGHPQRTLSGSGST